MKAIKPPIQKEIHGSAGTIIATVGDEFEINPPCGTVTPGVYQISKFGTDENYITVFAKHLTDRTEEEFCADSVATALIVFNNKPSTK